MKNDSSELIKYIDGKFGFVDQRLDQFTEGFQYVVKRFEGVDRRLEVMDRQTGIRYSAVETRLAEMEAKFDAVLTAIDGYASAADKYFQEMLALAHKVDRLERWLHQVADEVGIKLEY